MRDIASYAETYCDSTFESVQAEYRRRFVAELLERSESRRILEIGCGLQSIASEYDGFEQLVIVEPSDTFCEAASKDLACRGQLNRSVLLSGFFEDVVDEVLPCSFDMILVSGLLHEVDQPDEILRIVRQCCNADSVVHVNVPNADSLHRLLAVEMGLIETSAAISSLQEKLQQRRTFDLRTLEELTVACGFETRESGSYFPKYFTHAQMQELMQSGVVTEGMLDGLYRMAKYLPAYGSEIYVNLQRSM